MFFKSFKTLNRKCKTVGKAFEQAHLVTKRPEDRLAEDFRPNCTHLFQALPTFKLLKKIAKIIF